MSRSGIEGSKLVPDWIIVVMWKRCHFTIRASFMQNVNMNENQPRKARIGATPIPQNISRTKWTWKFEKQCILEILV